MKNGTPILWQRVFRVPSNSVLTLLFVCLGLLTSNIARPQCAPGQRATLNWDNLDYLVNTGTYTSDTYVNTAFCLSQNFAFGPANRLTLAVSNNTTLGGEVNTHTGDITDFTGDDVSFTPNANGETITLTFETAVTNLNFTLYDIDRTAVVTLSAQGGTVPMNVTTQSGSILTVASVGNLRTLTATNVGAANNLNTGTATISVPGSITTFTITFTAIGSDPLAFLSDIHACIAGSFPTNYYAVSQPYTGQPGYVLHAFNRSVYYIDPATGFTRHLFTDPTPAADTVGNINSMAYDPYNKILYFVYSLTNDGDSKTLKKYDVNTGVVSTVISDLENIGLPTTDDNGTESGSAAFYNGAYYIGVETSNSGRNSGREAVIWRIDFNGSNVPYRCSQVFATPIDSSGLLIHDWSDFVIFDGVLYNFDAAEVDNNPPGTALDRNQSDIYHVDLMTGATIRYNKPGHLSVPRWYPGQPAINWQGQIVQMYANPANPMNSGAQPQSNPYITFYNGAGGIGAPVFMFSTPAFVPAVPSLGDAAEAFKPKSDYGDAPSSYDNNPMSPATHERDSLIRLGGSVTYEWGRTASALADAEGAEENGVVAGPTALPTNATQNYTVQVSVFNNTGANATLAGWLDYNFDGVFQASEGVTLNVPTNTSAQTVSLTWNNIWVGLTSNVRTFLRLRVTRASNSMTTSNMNGWMRDGEVEDWPVLIGATLPKDLQSFDVKKKTNSTVDVKWNINVQQQVKDYTIMRSNDNINWIEIGTVSARDGFGTQNYTFVDQNPAPGKSYYRVRVNYQATGSNKLSEVRSVEFNNSNVFVRVLPNPAHEQAEVQVNALSKGDATISVYDRSGRMVIQLKQGVEAGSNSIRLQNLSKLSDGVYTIRTVVNGRTTSNQLIIKKQ